MSEFPRRELLAGTAAIATLALMGCTVQQPTLEKAAPPQDTETLTGLAAQELFTQDSHNAALQVQAMLSDIAASKTIELPADKASGNAFTRLSQGFPRNDGNESRASLQVTKVGGALQILASFDIRPQGYTDTGRLEGTELTLSLTDPDMIRRAEAGVCKWSELFREISSKESSKVSLEQIYSYAKLKDPAREVSVLRSSTDDGIAVVMPPNDKLVSGQPGFTKSNEYAVGLAKALLTDVKGR